MCLMETYRKGRFLARAEKWIRAGDLAQALALYDEGLSAMPDDGQILLHKAMTQALAGLSGEAEETLRGAMRLYPGRFTYPLVLGQLYYDLGEAEKALDMFQLASTLDPANDLVHAYLALTSLVLGQARDGYAEVGRWLDSANAGWLSRVLLFCEEHLAGHAGMPRPLERQISEAESANASARMTERMGRAVERGLTRAWHGMAKLLAGSRHVGNPARREARLRFLEGALRYDLEDYVRAGRAFSRSLELEPESELCRLRLADLSLQQEDYAGALRWLSEGQGVEGGWQTARLEIEGLALFHEGRYAEALDRLRQLASLQAQEYLPAYYVGMCYLRLLDRQEARKWFERAVGRPNPDIVGLRLEEASRVSE